MGSRRIRFRLTATTVLIVSLARGAETFPSVQADRLVADFGRHDAWEDRGAVFTLRNQGSNPARILSVRHTCGCAAAAADAPVIAPDGAVDVRVRLLPGTLAGAYTKYVYVAFEGVPTPLRLTLTGVSVPLFAVRPASSVRVAAAGDPPAAALTWELTAGETPAVLGPARAPEGTDVRVAVETPGPTPRAGGDAGLRLDVPAGATVRVAVAAAVAPGARFRLPVEIPVLSPAGHPPLRLLLYGAAPEARIRQ